MAEEATVSTRPVLRASRPTEREMMRAIKSELEALSLVQANRKRSTRDIALLLAGSVQLCLARPLSQTTFPSPDDAAAPSLPRSQRHDERAVTEILGAGTELVSSDDKVRTHST